MAKKINPNAIIALQKYREKLRNGEVKPAKRTSTEDRLAMKKIKLQKLMTQVEILKSEIARLDAVVNRTAKAEIVKGYTAAELAEAIKLLKAKV